MKIRPLRILKWIAIVVVVLIVVGIAFVTWKVKSSYPQTEGTLRLAGLEGPVEIVRDRWGVPHIWAESEHDLFFAQGFVHAQDRLWQMYFTRTVARAEIATLFGAAAIDADRYLRTLGLARSAEKDWELLSPETRRVLESYAAGVNAFLDSGAALPVEFMALGVEAPPWTPQDSLAYSKLMSLNLSLNSGLEMIRLGIAADLGDEAPARFFPVSPAVPSILTPEAGGYGEAMGEGGSEGEGGVGGVEGGVLTGDDVDQAPGAETEEGSEGDGGETVARMGYPRVPELVEELIPHLTRPDLVGGSNSWVVHGSRTATGKPLLANDTHLGLAMPSVWYENGLHGGDFDVVGFSLPGIPFVAIGQNARLAWGITNLNADVQDLFYERLDDPENPTKYEFEGEWRDLTVIRETLRAKGGEEQELVVRLTHHGPLMHEVSPPGGPTEPYSMAWPALDGSRLLDAMRRVNLAGNWQEFREGLSYWDSPSLNFIYADVDGNIGYQSTARTPIRAGDRDGFMPAEGWTGEAEWEGFIPFEEMPSGFNPPDGAFVTANHRVVTDDYPHRLTMDWPPSDRARRILALLGDRTGLTADDMRAIQADTYSLGAEALRPYFLAAAKPETDLDRAALAVFEEWDLRFEEGSAGAVVYEVWLSHFADALLEDDVSENVFAAFKGLAMMPSPLVLDLMERPSDPLFDDRGTEGVTEDRDAILAAGFRGAMEYLAERLGGDPADWRWGDLHTMSFGHQPLGQGPAVPVNWLLNSERIPVRGQANVVCAQAGSPAQDYAVGFGVSQRFIADLADLSRSRMANSTGQTAQLGHPNREDQIPLWRNVELHDVYTTRGSIPEDEARVLTLEPLKGEPAGATDESGDS